MQRARAHTRTSFLFPPALAAALGLACSTEPAREEVPSASAGADVSANASASGEGRAGASVAARVSPTLGGNVLVLESHQVELAIQESGLVRAAVFDAQGRPLGDGAGVELAVTLRAAGGARPRLALTWDAPSACFRGQAELAQSLVAEPIDVSLGVGGKVETGVLGEYALLPSARFGGTLVAAGPYSVELVAQPNLVKAFVLDAAGQVNSKADLKLQLGATASPLALTWDAAQTCHRASLAGALDLAQPVRIALRAEGKPYLGSAASLRALSDVQQGARARLQAGAELDAKAGASLQVPAPQVDARLKAGAKTLASTGTQLQTKAKAGAATLGKASAAVQIPKPKIQTRLKTSASSGAKSGASAQAGVKAKAGFGFGK